ncbi:MAG: methylmalonyl Co-A mutase-associated GTPase MeaB [Ignavibacteria bacterium]|nr:methylmalonyl Co-A mutase-associated GTPase MeaB [Ignavibacteria bacterium]
MNDTELLVKGVLSAEKRMMAKALSRVENESPDSELILQKLFSHTGKAHRIGITGPPGAGKSTLTNNLIKVITGKGKKVGVIAVDPTSPFTGGALLGDRIRMQESGLLENVFIRSMATRGSLGGLCKNVVEACDVLDASGMDFVIIETVGVGQSELDIAQTADTVVVVLVPESGDAVQAMKAGLMEIADIFVLNKSEREGADAVAATIKNIIHLKPPSEDGWIINVLKTVGSRNEGSEELFQEIVKHMEHLEATGYLQTRRKRHLENKVIDMVNYRLRVNFWDKSRKEMLESRLDRMISKQEDPYSFVESITG